MVTLDIMVDPSDNPAIGMIILIVVLVVLAGVLLVALKKGVFKMHKDPSKDIKGKYRHTDVG